MIKSYIFLLLILTTYSGVISANDNPSRNRAKLNKVQFTDNGSTNVKFFYNGPGMQLEGPRSSDNFSIGGEIPIQELSGFYDWQTNGDCKRQLYFLNGQVLHAIYTTSTDSLQVNISRKTEYSFSSNAGLNWYFSVQVPTERSGYGYLTIDSGNLGGPIAVIVNHYGTPLKSYVHTDAFLGLGSFTSTVSNSTRNYAWPQANQLGNGNVLVAGKTYNDNVSTDTLAAQIFQPGTYQWQEQPQFFQSSASDHFDMRITSATGPSGKALLVMSPVYDHGGSFGANRIFYWTSTNYGVNWTGPNLLYDTHIDSDGDTSKPWVGLDAVYDKYGNFYVVFNTTGLQETYSSAKIWINKNGTTNRIVARNSDISGAMTSAAGTPMQDVCSMDWPSVSVSEYGDLVCCAFSVAKQNDVVNGFNSMDIYATSARTGILNFSFHDQITQGINDERFVSLNREFYGDFFRKVPMVYQKDPQPGTSAPDASDMAPLSRSTLVYREYEFIWEMTAITGNGVLTENYRLHQNYPNPFNPATNIKFEIPKSGNVKLRVYNIAGKLVAELLNQNLSPGTYETNWNGDGFASGVYYYRLEAEGFKETRKMLLIK